MRTEESPESERPYGARRMHGGEGAYEHVHEREREWEEHADRYASPHFRRGRPADLRTGQVLGLLSIAVGVTALLAPRMISRAVGMSERPLLMRAVGARELVSGVGLLTQRNQTPWLWSRVLGDALDAALVGAAVFGLGRSHAEPQGQLHAESQRRPQAWWRPHTEPEGRASAQSWWRPRERHEGRSHERPQGRPLHAASIGSAAFGRGRSHEKRPRSRSEGVSPGRPRDSGWGGLGAMPSRSLGALALIGAIGAVDLIASLRHSRHKRHARRIEGHHSPAGSEAVTAGRGAFAEQAIVVGKTPKECYAFWRDFSNLPRFIPQLKTVTMRNDGMLHWVAQIPGDRKLEWDARITADREGERIAWHSVPGSSMKHAGVVRFEEAPGGRGCVVRAAVHFQPPMGLTGRAFAKAVGRDPSAQARDNLRRFKQLIETGEIPTTHGQPSGRRSWKGRLTSEGRKSRQGDGLQEMRH